jgi:hypothetical protein
MGSVTNVTSNGATFSWSTAGLTDSTYIYSQQLDIIRYSDGAIAYTVNPTAGATSAIVSNANIVSGTTYYAKLTIIANDGWKTSGSPTQQISTSSNFVPFSSPVNTVVPTLSPLNNRSYVPMSTISSTNQGTWTGTDLNTIYRYQWLYYNGDVLGYQGYVNIAGAITSSYSVPSNYTSVYGSTIRSRVTAANPIPGVSTIAASGNGSYATITTNIPHNLSAGNVIIINGMTPAGYNGLYTISSVTSNTITYANATTTAQTVSGTIYLATHAYSSAYNVEAGVTVTGIGASPTSVGINTNTTLTATISNYPTSYIISWGDGTQTNSGTLTSGTSSVGVGQTHSYTTTGTKTIGITAQPGNVFNSVNVTVAPAVTINSYPTISGTGAVGTNISFAAGSYNNAASVTTHLVVSLNTSFSSSSGVKTSTSPYTVTSGDTAGSPYYFATRDTVVGLDGVTYYFWSGGYSGASVTIPQGSGSILSYNPNVAPTISGSSISPSSGTAGSTTFTAYAGTVTGSPTPTISYQWQYFNTSFVFVNIAGATSQSYTPPSNFNTLYPNYGFYCLITASNGISPDATARPSATLNNPVSPPSGGTVSISTNTGNYNVGSVITYSTSGWANSPTSYYLELHNGTNPVLTSDPLRASTTSTSGSYTITSSDVPNYFKAWATATNSGGSTVASSAQVGPAAGTPTGTAPTTPSGLSNSYSSGPSWTGSWSASSGTAPITYYWSLYQAQTSGGAVTATASGSTTGTSFTQSMNSANGLWAYFTVYANNAYGNSMTATSGWA